MRYIIIVVLVARLAKPQLLLQAKQLVLQATQTQRKFQKSLLLALNQVIRPVYIVAIAKNTFRVIKQLKQKVIHIQPHVIKVVTYVKQHEPLPTLKKLPRRKQLLPRMVVLLKSAQYVVRWQAVLRSGMLRPSSCLLHRTPTMER